MFVTAFSSPTRAGASQISMGLSSKSPKERTTLLRSPLRAAPSGSSTSTVRIVRYCHHGHGAHGTICRASMS